MTTHLIFESKSNSILFKWNYLKQNYHVLRALVQSNTIDSANFEEWLEEQFTKNCERLSLFLKTMLANESIAKILIPPLKNNIQKSLSIATHPEGKLFLINYLEMCLLVIPEFYYLEFLKILTRVNYIPIIIETFTKLSHTAQRNRIALLLIKLGIQQSNITLLRDFILSVNLDDIELSKNDFEQANALLKLEERRSKKTIELMEQFYGFDNFFGSINLEGGLLTCAQINQRKKANYDFYPTLLEAKDFKYYLKELKKLQLPVRERFLLTGLHWIAGDIEIKTDRKVLVLLIDSTGKREEYYEQTLAAMKTIKHLFPDSTLFASMEQRQYDQVSCSVFALDDIQHLFTVERYLDKKYHLSGLFGYLQDLENYSCITTKTHDFCSFEIVETRLPLAFLRTTQTRKLFDSIYQRSEAEQQLTVSKNGNTIIESARNDFTFSEEKVINYRIHKKLDKMMTYNACFFRNTIDFKVIDNLMNQFTFTGFKSRVSQISP